MSYDLYQSYARDFEQCITQLREMLDNPSATKRVQKENPYEFSQAQNYLKQMEIEQMNILENDETSNESREVKTSFQKHKKTFDKIRKEIRKA